MHTYAPPTAPMVTYAGFWKRVAAYFIDYAVIGFAAGCVIRAIDLSMNNGFSEYDYYSSRYMHYLTTLMLALFQWSYFAGMESSPLRATIGKLAVGLYVTDLYGNRASFGKTTGRHFGKIISALILGVGFIMAGFTERKQALHDTMASTLVLAK